MKNSVVLRLGDLRSAADKLGPLRAPAGARGSISRTTEIKPDPHGVSVETPFVETSVRAEGAWRKIVSVDGRRLRDTLDLLKKQWKDIGGDDAQITLSTSDTFLEFSWSGPNGTRRQTIPLVPLR
ncbi:MAG TPA: hypothetical protein VEA80_02295 [Vitreimonas sp.]|uniref:hypothetical protein n=1 Tax=Vitreimonas sp. TaxID=3069702 RepID=UPI002D3AE2A0|nr:hypothetical protein [Vitreimonas sp.]HYD86280.1 hypothetical protein [Vitreimonas sp.]